MIKSMTGFGRYEAVRDKLKITVEIKAVNHRYLDINIKLPKKLSNFEIIIRSQLKEYIQRGKVDVYVSCEDSAQRNSALQYHEEMAGEYLNYLNTMAETFHLENDIRVSTLARFPEVFTMEEQNASETELETILEEAVKGAAGNFVDSRIKEGANLEADLMGKLDEIIAEYRRKLEGKVKELLEDKQIDESRIAAEVTIYADKICVDEETVRLRSHIGAVKNELLSGGSVGRKLDFIAQEMNREANTILSKANDLSVSGTGIELKTLIEKVREQIQNIE